MAGLLPTESPRSRHRELICYDGITQLFSKNAPSMNSGLTSFRAREVKYDNIDPSFLRGPAGR